MGVAHRVGAGMSEPRLLDPLEALARAIERLRTSLPDRWTPLAASRRDLLEIATHDVLRALVSARRTLRTLELEGLAVLDMAAHELGSERLRALGCHRLHALGNTGGLG